MKRQKVSYEYLFDFYIKYKKLALVIGLINKKSLWAKEHGEDCLIEKMILSFIKEYEDPYADYMIKECSANYEWGLHYETKFGIMFRDAGRKGIFVSHIVPGGEADKKGIKLGDLVYGVNGNRYSALGDMEKALRDTKESHCICVDIYNGDEMETYTLSEIPKKDTSVKEEKIGKNIVFIKISNFAYGTYDAVKEIYQRFDTEEEKHIIIDLCDNMGGIVEECIKIANLFCYKGTMGIIEDNTGKREYINAEDKDEKNKFYTLVNKATGSASEFLVAALKNCNNAIIIGEKTYGKGLMQECYEFMDGTSLKISTHEMLLPNMNKIEGQGIVPDYFCEKGKRNFCLNLIENNIR